MLQDQTTAERAAHQGVGDQTKGRRRRTQRLGTADAQIFQHRAKGAGSAVTAHHRDRAGAETQQRAEPHQLGQSHRRQILHHDQSDDAQQEDQQTQSAALEHPQVGLKAN